MDTSKTASDEYWFNSGDGFVHLCLGLHKIEPKIYKLMLCGHTGLLIGDRFVCQTCWGYEMIERKVQQNLERGGLDK